MQTYKEFIDNIINTRGQWNIHDGNYYEKHHILPVCMGGEGDFFDEKTQSWKFRKESHHPNCIWLSASEHFIAHKLLAEENVGNVSLAYAYFCMASKVAAKTNKRLYDVTSEEFEESKLLIIEAYKLNSRSEEFKNKVSNGMKKYRAENGFSEDHLRHIRETTAKHRDENHAKGLTLYGTPLRKNGECGALRQYAQTSKAVYCIFEGKRYDFESMREAAIWWHSVSPLTNRYIECNLQRRIRDSANSLQIKYKGNIIDNIKWYWRGGDDNE